MKGVLIYLLDYAFIGVIEEYIEQNGRYYRFVVISLSK